MGIVAPYLPYERLRQIAREFLGRHHQAGDMPIPIESIIEFDFCLDIVPMPGLKDEFDVDAFITKDLAEIRVDEFIYKNRLNRYRFSLAHELAHLLLHRDVFAVLNFDGIDEWKQAICSIPEDQYRLIESQAYSFAGLALVPDVPLKDVLCDHIERMNKAGVEISDLTADMQRTLFASIGKEFQVSADVIQRRIGKDKLLA